MFSYSIYVVCSLYVTFLHPQSGPLKSWHPALCFKIWDIRSFSRLQSLTLTFTSYYSRDRGTRLVSIWLDQGFNSYVMYCTVLYSTVLYCTVPYCTLLYCTVLYRTVIYCTVLYCNVRCKYIGIHSRNDYFGFITANFLEFNTRGDRGG